MKNLFVIISLISLVFCSCAPYAKMNELRLTTSIQDVIMNLGPPSRVVLSESSVLGNNVFLSLKIYEYTYFDGGYRLLFINDKLAHWGTQESIDRYLANLVEDLAYKLGQTKAGNSNYQYLSDINPCLPNVKIVKLQLLSELL